MSLNSQQQTLSQRLRNMILSVTENWQLFLSVNNRVPETDIFSMYDDSKVPFIIFCDNNKVCSPEFDSLRFNEYPHMF